MKADTSRTTFDPRKHYQGVYLQQGRVQIDADWNEQVALTAHRLRRVARDIVGPAGVPRVAAGFACAPTADGLDLTITPGRLHVAGQVCENETPVTLKSQPHWPPEGPLVITEAESLPLADIPNGLYLVELDVWSRTVTALEDPALLEPALGGADTTFRSQLIWQARLVAVAPQSGGYQCGDPLPAWLRARRASTGTLTADTTKAPETLDDCELSATAGYRRLENQHYRVEIHTAGADGTATFKWSRENGSIVVPWKDRNGQRLSMGSAAGDLHRRFASGDTIELLSDTHILQGMPGVILTVEGVADDQLTVAEAPAQIPDPGSFGPHPRIRRWEGGPPQPVVAGSPMPLEAGIQITFGAGNFRSGDYWSIPARTGGAGLLWPKNAVDEQMELPPAGIAHAYAPLALVVASGGKLTMAGDCRTVFPPLTDIRADDVSFDNNNCGNDMQKADTVQEAIEVLCQRPTGGGGAAQTCDIHVNPREAIPLEERIKKLVDAGHQQLCLCLAPGEHITKSPLHISTENDGLHTLHLRGCGPASRLSIQKPLALDLKSLRIEGLALRPTAEAGPIILAGEGTIQLVENSVSGTLEKAAPLVIIEASGDILLSGNRLRPTSTDRNRMLKELFPQSILEVNMDTAAFRNRRRFRRAAALAAARLTSRTRTQRISRGEQWKNALSAGRELSPAVEDQINRIHKTLAAESVAGRRLLQQLERLRNIAFAEAPAAALAIQDGESRVHLVDNVLDGDLLLYGHEPGSLDEVDFKRLLNVQIHSDSQGSLSARGNRFTRIRLASAVTDKVRKAIDIGEFVTQFDLFQHAAWTDNQFRALKSAMAAATASFNSNHFNSATVDHVATSIAQQATFTGNIGPVDPEKKEMGTLYDISPTGSLGMGRAGNWLRIVP